MKYSDTARAVFLRRPNRFIAVVDLDGRETVVHVKNTGRCRELLVPGATVILEHSQNPDRKTAYDLIAVYKGELLINMDSQAPNKVFAEWAENNGFPPLRPETTKGDSRFDFAFDGGYIEVKGVTLEEHGVARFPDAPTARGAKHLRGLISCAKEGLEAYLVFIVQMAGMRRVEPNAATDPDFAAALKEAKEAGVHIIALGCHVEENALEATYEVPVRT